MTTRKSDRQLREAIQYGVEFFRLLKLSYRNAYRELPFGSFVLCCMCIPTPSFFRAYPKLVELLVPEVKEMFRRIDHVANLGTENKQLTTVLCGTRTLVKVVVAPDPVIETESTTEEEQARLIGEGHTFAPAGTRVVVHTCEWDNATGTYLRDNGPNGVNVQLDDRGEPMFFFRDEVVVAPDRLG